MKRVISISEVVDSHEVTKGTRDVIAMGDAVYDEGRSELVMELKGRVIVTNARGNETTLQVEWLPKPETIRERVSPDETQGLARELFHRWIVKVRAAIPSLAGATVT